MIKYTVLTLVTCALALAGYLYSHLGVTRPVTVAFETRGPLTFVSKDHLGAYHQILPVIRAVEDWASANHLNCVTTFGEYLDDPPSVDEDRLRSRGGCVFENPPPVATPPEFRVSTRAPRLFAVARFAGSPAIGPYKVYPKVRAFLSDNHRTSTAPVIELYTVHGDEVETEYLFAVDNAL